MMHDQHVPLGTILRMCLLAWDARHSQDQQIQSELFYGRFYSSVVWC